MIIMAWDLYLDPGTRDLKAGIVKGVDETMQRLITRLNRELGEWFLNTSAGLPWYQKGTGMLGSKDKNRVELLIRKETLGTEGVNRIVILRTLFVLGSRNFNIFMTLVLEPATVINLTLTEEGATWQITE